MATEPPLDGGVLPPEFELGSTVGDGDVAGLVLWVDVPVGLGGRIVAPVDGCPELYGVGLGLQACERPAELVAEE